MFLTCVVITEIQLCTKNWHYFTLHPEMWHELRHERQAAEKILPVPPIHLHLYLLQTQHIFAQVSLTLLWLSCPGIMPPVILNISFIY
jgi:hypothetical protein